MSKESVLAEMEVAITQLRCGKPVIVGNGDERCVMLALECTPFHVLGDFIGQSRQSHLLLTAHRARVIFPQEDIQTSVVIPMTDVKQLPVLAGFSKDAVPEVSYDYATGLHVKALALAKLAKLMPAVLIADVDEADYIEVAVEAIDQYEDVIADTLQPVCQAPLTLAQANEASITVFRSGTHEHYTILVGEIDEEKAPLVRIHSSCFTGDVLASLRCDCRDQLQTSLHMMAEEGGGVLVYLMQEGRGIGLVNKLRAYALQAEGMDTVDANKWLGFDDDERPFLPAAAMLKKLGITNVRLMTNNPRKVDGLKEYGITVAERVPVVVTPHTHNDAYLETKFSKLGHVKHE